MNFKFCGAFAYDGRGLIKETRVDGNFNCWNALRLACQTDDLGQ